MCRVLKSVAIAAGCALATHALADSDDRYRYDLVQSKEERLCRHMEKVYNERFAYPWKRPYLTVEQEGPYGPQSDYAFPKLSGVEHDARMAFETSFSRQPTSPEFDAIEWREGRYTMPGNPPGYELLPMLVANADIDNDGVQEIVIKSMFMLTYYPAGRAPGGEDTLFVFEPDTINLNKTMDFKSFYRGQDGKPKPAMIGVSDGYFNRIIRPFVFEGVTYLSAYVQGWSPRVADPDSLSPYYHDPKDAVEVMWVDRYRGGGDNLGAGQWTPLRIDRLCKFQMSLVK